MRICLILGFLLILAFLKEKVVSYLDQKSNALVTIIITDFEDWHLPSQLTTVKSVLHLQENLDIVIALQNMPYPPVTFPKQSNIKVILEDHSFLNHTYLQNDLYYVIKTDYVFIITSETIVTKLSIFYLQQLLEANKDHGVNILSIPVNKSEIICLGTKFKYKQWTVQDYSLPGSEICDSIAGNHVIFMRTIDFLSLPNPLLHPVSQSLYLQSGFKEWKSKIIHADSEIKLSSAMKSIENDRKHGMHKEEQLKNMYKKLGIKLVQNSDGKENWYGCSKETVRCFPTVVNDMPDYLYMNKWTPPCCLKNLRTTARYVFKMLENQGVRYWLEGGSLLGAARSGDIIPWDYDVDIGIYEEDIVKCEYLVRARSSPVVDADGFLWENAHEGKFFRVQYSTSNHLHVDIFPFYSRNGIMTKDTWLSTHRQDREFPEHFLKPLTKLNFVGMQVAAPNNWTEFLEYKFGKGVISNPKYPNSKDVL